MTITRYRLRFIHLALTATTYFGCTTPQTLPPPKPLTTTPLYGDYQKRVAATAIGKKAMIATAHPLASEAGIAMLKEGGNAIDAAVAASFVISVVRPQSTGLGGGGFLLMQLPKDKQVKAFDFRERAPLLATRDMYLDATGQVKKLQRNGQTLQDLSIDGPLAVATPGLVAGLHDLHQRYGTLPWPRVLDHAIQAAEQGFRVYESLAKAIIDRQAILEQFPESQKLFLPNGIPLKVGDTLVQQDLGKTLRRIAIHGANDFYRGDIAKAIIAALSKEGGILSAADLAQYQMIERKPVNTDYRGFQVYSMPPPSSGGIHLIQMLNMLEQDDLSSMALNSEPYVHLVAEVMKRAFYDRAKYLGDPDFVAIPTLGLISKAYAKALRQGINLNVATPAKHISNADPTAFESPSTTHISVVDPQGGAVSTTQTINYAFGSGMVAGTTGIVLNDEMDDFSAKPGVGNVYGLVGSEANSIAAKKTMLSSMTPTIVRKPNGEIHLVLGSPGGPRIINATFQVVLNVIDHRLTLPDAVHGARFHHQWLPDEIRIEDKAELAPTLVHALTKKGHQITTKGAVGDVQAIMRFGDGSVVGVSDTRSEGQPKGF